MEALCLELCQTLPYVFLPLANFNLCPFPVINYTMNMTVFLGPGSPSYKASNLMLILERPCPTQTEVVKRAGWRNLSPEYLPELSTFVLPALK